MDIPSVNWHVFPRCNYACSFCYARFDRVRKVLPLDEAERLVSALAGAGVRKLTFVGGEPLLHPQLPFLVRAAKATGMTTMVVTNASKLDAAFLDAVEGALDWVGISLDSAKEDVQKRLGRGHGDHVKRATAAFELLRSRGVQSKLNTVVTSLNWREDMSAFLAIARPKRWKVFQVLPIAGENDDDIERLRVTDDQFKAFVARHRQFRPVAEDNAAMTGSYAMVDPLGRFFQNIGGRYAYGRAILEVGVQAAAEDVGFSVDAFRARGGLYEWD